MLPMTAQAAKHHRDGKGGGRGAHATAASRASGSRSAHVRVRSGSHLSAHSARKSNAHLRAYNHHTNRSRVAGRTNAVVNRSNNHVRTLRGTNVTKNNRLRAQNRVAVNRQRNINRNRNVAINRQGNARIVNNWRSSRFSGRNYAAFRNYHREWHNRSWWRNHYNRIEFVLGGWWYWNAGYWYPAWGYSPYAYYPYYGPIYTGYASLTPYQVTLNVQIQLQHDGYYAGPIDGILGPQTRGALAAFQADHGLAITSAIDEPTLATLGLT
jgi:hypothetical protein